MTAAQPQDRERNVSTDVLRGLAIVLVVFGHACRGVIEKAGGAGVDGLSNLDFALYTTHMPAFFVIAGYYTERSLRSRSAPAYLASRFWDVVYPYVLWSILYWIIHLIMGRFTHINHPITASDVLNIWWDPIHVLWFLYALMAIQIVAVSLRRRPALFLGGSFLVLAAMTFSPYRPVVEIIAVIVRFCPFFAVGYWLSSRKAPLIYPVLGSPLVLALLTGLFAVGCWLALRWGIRTPVGLYTLPLSALGVALLMGLAQAITPQRPVARHLAWIGVSSMAIYLLHVVVLALAPRALALLGLSSAPALIAVGSLVGVYGSLAAFEILKRLRLAGLMALTGGRPFAAKQGPMAPAPDEIR